MNILCKDKMTLHNKSVLCVEKVDKEALEMILDNFEELAVKHSFHIYKAGLIEDLKSVKTVLSNYYNSLNENGELEIDYSQRDGMGRRFGDKVGIINLQKSIRHTIAHKYHIDIDMVNAHPVLLYNHLMNTGYEPARMCHLRRYIEHRDDVLEETKLEREEAKTIFLKIINGGKVKDTTPFVEAFQTEMQAIQSFVAESFPRFVKKAEKNCRKKNSSNVLGSTINLLMCELENNVLERMIDFFQGRGVRVTSLAYDGLTIERNKDNMDNIKTMIHECTQTIRENGVPHYFQLKVKEMDQLMDLSSFHVRKKNTPIPVKSINCSYDGFIPSDVYKSFVDSCDILFDTRQMGCGKTTSVIQYGGSFKSQLIITNRISTIEQLTRENTQFKSYRKLGNDKAPSYLITCLNSLHTHFKGQKTIHHYNVIAIDEICSVLKQTDMKDCEEATLLLLDILQYYEGKLILMDANLDDESIAFIQSFRPNAKVNVLGGKVNTTGLNMHINRMDIKKMKHTSYLENLPINSRKAIISSNMNIYTSNEMIIKYIQTHRPESRILHINKDTRDDINFSTDHLVQYDFIVVSPTISEGVSFNDDVFSEYDFYGFFHNLSTDADTAVQMCRRWRKIQNYYITIGFDEYKMKYTNEDEYYAYLNSPLQKVFKTYLTRTVVFDPQRKQSRFQIFKDEFWKVHSRNELLREYQKSHFYSCFLQKCVNNGFRIVSEEYNNVRSDCEIVENIPQSEVSKLYDESKEEHYKNIQAAKLLNKEQVEHLDKSKCSTEQSLQLKKFYIHNTLLIDKDTLEPDTYEEWDNYRKQSRIHALRLFFDFTYTSLENGTVIQKPSLDIVSHLRSNMYSKLELKNSFWGQKKLIDKTLIKITNIHTFLQKLGFDNIPCVLESDAFCHTFNIFYSTFKLDDYHRLCSSVFYRPSKEYVFETESEFERYINTADKCLTLVNKLIDSVLPIHIQKGSSVYYLKMTETGFSLNTPSTFRMTTRCLPDTILNDVKYKLFFEGEGNVFCEYCKKQYGSHEYYSKHVYTDIHKRNKTRHLSPPKTKVSYSCDKCHKEFHDKTKYEKHIHKKNPCRSPH